MCFSEGSTVFLCGGCGEELEECPEDFYRCKECGVEIDSRNSQKVKA